MSELPFDRLQPEPPFTYSGVDFFGPFIVKEGRKEMKRWGVIFTCMASRAVHLETANSLDTSSFINALRRFMSVRGTVRQLRSDRGTNFIGAKRELREAVEEMDDDHLKHYLSDLGCDFLVFKTNVPSASHMGGIWERQIRTVRSTLSSIMQDFGSQLDDETLRTFFSEAMAIVNSRPLSIATLNDPLSVEPLTPNHLIDNEVKGYLATAWEIYEERFILPQKMASCTVFVRSVLVSMEARVSSDASGKAKVADSETESLHRRHCSRKG
ncbi:hypothetical protein FSP39_023413 [Pinctada imbricata]|uniref:Integrase catalytic domain-containing protein n=1 Tax=Pinctada imbricata TaxID=66713 RepID=A0AA88Y608_PINIB|nr:hypothetical protein FSP39_023413 [Pinctada imbricata]